MYIPLISNDGRTALFLQHSRLINKTAEQSMKISFLLSTLAVWLAPGFSLFMYIFIFWRCCHEAQLCLETRLVGGRVGRLPVCSVAV